MGGGGGGGRLRFGRTRGASPRIHKGRQEKHIEGSKNYNQQIANQKTPSILTEDPEQLLREGAGKGQIVNPNKEVVDFGRVIGKFYDIKTSKFYETTRGTIHYDQHGNAHIVPARPNDFEK